jgi:hypothetical protein
VRRAIFFSLLFFASCKDEPPVPPDCGGPDFDVIVTTALEDARLPADTVVRVDYGGNLTEEHGIEAGELHDNVFCDQTDRYGSPVSVGGQGGEGVSQTGQAGQGGAGSGSSAVEALRCRLWTDGPATVKVMTSLYPTVETRLRSTAGVCTISAKIEIGPDNDGGA